jgi:hypothetical protein
MPLAAFLPFPPWLLKSREAAADKGSWQPKARTLMDKQAARTRGGRKR